MVVKIFREEEESIPELDERRLEELKFEKLIFWQGRTGGIRAIYIIYIIYNKIFIFLFINTYFTSY